MSFHVQLVQNSLHSSYKMPASLINYCAATTVIEFAFACVSASASVTAALLPVELELRLHKVKFCLLDQLLPSSHSISRGVDCLSRCEHIWLLFIVQRQSHDDLSNFLIDCLSRPVLFAQRQHLGCRKSLFPTTKNICRLTIILT